jgi:hypothetical protein
MAAVRNNFFSLMFDVNKRGSTEATHAQLGSQAHKHGPGFESRQLRTWRL